MASYVSSSFVLVLDETITAGQVASIAPLRALRVVSARAKGAGNATWTVAKAIPGGLATTFCEGAISDSFAGWVEGSVTVAQAGVSPSQEIQIVASGGTITGVVLECIGNPAASLDVTIA